ncbi:hypothetical protein V8C86DRAFT_211621 [Haematococcus lacustris]
MRTMRRRMALLRALLLALLLVLSRLSRESREAVKAVKGCQGCQGREGSLQKGLGTLYNCTLAQVMLFACRSSPQGRARTNLCLRTARLLVIRERPCCARAKAPLGSLMKKSWRLSWRPTRCMENKRCGRAIAELWHS